ncbi:MAG TPA: cytochrome b N-terminal domain-containing protein [Planctomycetaceae bacterium]|nr:cytochrome b N-terminal domain-containing protein [Planctomycetaceae bacterium]
MGRWREWAADRFGWKPLADTVLHRRVASGAWYFGDGATLALLLGVLVATGAAMSLTYSPGPETAHESVSRLTHDVILGWFVRALHYWAAGVMVVMLFFHLFREILVGGYKAPREGTWLVGVVMLFLVLAMSFTGYVLRWDERGFYAARVAMHTVHNVPVIGERLVLFLQGGDEAGPYMLTRFYAAHVILVPLFLLPLVGYHLYLVMLHGITSPTERRQPVATAEEQRRIYEADKNSPDRGATFYPATMLQSGAMAAVVFAGVVALAVFVGPRDIETEANLVQRSLPAEEWWFWWYSALIALLPPWLAPAFVVLFPILAFVALVLLPFLDRTPHRGIRNRPVWCVIVTACVVAMLWLTDLRRRSPWTGWPDPEPPPVPAGVELAPDVERGRQLFARFGCNSCHPVAGHGRQVGVDLTALGSPRARDEIRDYVLRPPEGVAMPAYQDQIDSGRMSREELELIVGFVHVAQTFPRNQ